MSASSYSDLYIKCNNNKSIDKILTVALPFPSVNSIFTVSFPAPCAPQSVMYTGNRQSAVLFWNTSVFATSYTVYNVSRGTRVKLCNTTELSCQLTDFDPNATIVTASNAVGESNPSQNITGQTDSSGLQPARNLGKQI